MALTGKQISEVERFPDQNPNPVLRISGDGFLLYANPASRPILDEWKLTVGSPLPAGRLVELRDAVASGRPVDIRCGHFTYELLAVDVADLGFMNVYGSDVTARKAIEMFPDENPNPVFRFRWDGTLVYANPASRPIIDALGAVIGESLTDQFMEPLLAQVRNGLRDGVEVRAGERLYRLLAVDVPAFDFINVYGTDITAARRVEELHRENERLLLNILPEPIAERLRNGEALIADKFEDVTLLFADIVEFTQMASDMSPDELVRVLNDVFTVFDTLVEEYGLEKVKTIGDAYMVVGGMLDPSDDHVDRVAAMALDLADRVGANEAAVRLGVRFRVGIHCGPIIAGVIGTKKFIYDVWGDTVNVASRMESLGVPGRIQVTGAVEQRLRGKFRFEPRGIIDVKGKGPTPTWFLAGPRRSGRLAAGTSSQRADRAGGIRT